MDNLEKGVFENAKIYFVSIENVGNYRKTNSNTGKRMMCSVCTSMATCCRNGRVLQALVHDEVQNDTQGQDQSCGHPLSTMCSIQCAKDRCGGAQGARSKLAGGFIACTQKEVTWVM